MKYATQVQNKKNGLKGCYSEAYFNGSDVFLNSIGTI